jgi:hypothetical protein
MLEGRQKARCKMQIVIDISEDDYRKVQDGRASVSMMRKAIRNGTPLTKGHGRLIDADAIVMPIMESENDEKWMRVAINSAPTIIEADTESEEA